MILEKDDENKSFIFICAYVWIQKLLSQAKYRDFGRGSDCTLPALLRRFWSQDWLGLKDIKDPNNEIMVKETLVISRHERGYAFGDSVVG